MSKTRTETERTTTVTALPEPLQTETPAPIVPARVFRDTRYTSRTLIMPDDTALPVIAGRVTACGDDQYAFLKAHPDMQLLTE
ncbi:hypothetical protein [Pseudomonas brassicacearum]|uniref:hypothetical protein n=1 Tax=Pseudomonas brassicacearum TaxID=930166 RepID=UPI002732442E|nr:hypothetical protein [Pseudomonas brassicacearum]WLG69324.1 hypothetical protein PSH71_05850 [Pseudomonas brassicacearum]